MTILENSSKPVMPAIDVTDDYLDCTDHIAYQYSNLIQSHVLFFNVDRQDGEILNTSANVDDWVDCSAEDLIGRTLDDTLFPGISAAFRTMEKRALETSQLFSHCVCDRIGNPVLCRITVTASRWLVELEKEEHDSGDIDNDIQMLHKLFMEGVETLGRQQSLQESISGVMGRLRELLGFERAMCYRFDDDDNGEVIAESLSSPGTMSYLGLRFPSRDIPRTARQMLLTSSIRATRDQQSDCYPIFPSKDPITREYVDLTFVRGRGAAGACREYYRNLNIRSSLVMPLIVDNRLWGLMSFHDQQVRCVSPRMDEYLRSIAQCISLSIERHLRELLEQARQKGSMVVTDLSQLEPTSNQWLNGIQSRVDDLKGLVECDGFILRLAGQDMTAGIVPDASERPGFIAKLGELAQGEMLSTNCLSKLDPEMARYSHVAAGVIAIPLSKHQNDFAVWIRREQKQSIRWAGDPMASIENNPGGSKRLCVRESFEVWVRVTEKKCLPWNAQELCLVNSASMNLRLLTLSWHATRASEAKTQFLSNMSHEIRTPMTAILGYTNLLKEQLQPDMDCSQAQSFIDVIQRNGTHLLSVIDDILNLAKIEAGKLTVERLSIAMPELLAEVVSLIKVQGDVKGLGFRVELTTPIPRTIFSDAVRLRQILLNLLGNAFKFTEHGMVMLKVAYEAATRQIAFDVIDTGIGLTELQISQLFNPFTQADSSTTRRFGGSGLGLNISKKFAQLLGGEISVESEIGVGSTFRLSIASGCSEEIELIDHLESPIVPATPRTKPGESNTSTMAPMPSLTGLRIMLLEDCVDNQRLLRHMLSKAGAEVSIHSNGKLGIESVTLDGKLDSPLQSPLPFDLILTDMQMPELDGYSTVRLLREKGCRHPIIALTAFAMQGNDQECMNAGCDDYLSKPLTRESLLAKCLKWAPTARIAPMLDSNAYNAFGSATAMT